MRLNSIRLALGAGFTARRIYRDVFTGYKRGIRIAEGEDGQDASPRESLG
jgi:hypothetical protein